MTGAKERARPKTTYLARRKNNENKVPPISTVHISIQACGRLRQRPPRRAAAGMVSTVKAIVRSQGR